MWNEVRCPTKACSGWVCEVEDSPAAKFYGCGSCGNVWFSVELLNKAIDNIIDRYPYRQSVYIRAGADWHPVERAREPRDYCARVEMEWDN